MPVRITIDGQSFLTDDLTVDEAVGIERATGVSWLQLNPLVSADHCRAVMVAFLSRQIPEEEAAKKAGAMTVKEAIAACNLVDDDLPDTYEDGVPNPVGEATTT